MGSGKVVTPQKETAREPRKIAVALDLFCKAGGATKGLQRAGFYVKGVDIEPQPNYCGNVFTQADALDFPLPKMCDFVGGSQDHFPEICDRCGENYWHQDHGEYLFVWASPPCQRHTRLNGINKRQYKDHIAAIRERLKKYARPFVIENVVGAPLIEPKTLCGSMFGLGVWRHRLFECYGFGFPTQECNHAAVPLPLDVTGTGGPCVHRKTAGGGLHRKPRNMAEAKAAMGIDWMTRREIVQAIPPAYAEFIGSYAYRIIPSGEKAVRA